MLLDAPCSGSGTLRRNPGMRWQITEENVSSLGETQSDIIRDAIPMVRPGGWIIYATCSVLSEENEAVVERALRENSRLEVVPVTEAVGPEISAEIRSGDYMRMGPHSHDSDGFFAAVLKVNL